MKLSSRASKVWNHSSQLTCRSLSLSPPKSNRSTPRWSSCSVPSTVAGVPPRSSAQRRITSWLGVARLRPSRSGSSSSEVISWAYCSDREVCSPVRRWPSSGPRSPGSPASPPPSPPPSLLLLRPFLPPLSLPPSWCSRWAVEIASTSSAFFMVEAPSTPASSARSCRSLLLVRRSSVSLRSGVLGVSLVMAAPGRWEDGAVRRRSQVGDAVRSCSRPTRNGLRTHTSPARTAGIRDQPASGGRRSGGLLGPEGAQRVLQPAGGRAPVSGELRLGLPQVELQHQRVPAHLVGGVGVAHLQRVVQPAQRPGQGAGVLRLRPRLVQQRACLVEHRVADGGDGGVLVEGCAPDHAQDPEQGDDQQSRTPHVRHSNGPRAATWALAVMRSPWC